MYAAKAALRLGLTKGGKRTGQEEMGVINSRVAVRWLRRACANKGDSQLVISRGADFFRKCFKLLIAEFGVAESNISVYFRRREGATWDFLSYQSMERCCEDTGHPPPRHVFIFKMPSLQLLFDRLESEGKL